MHPVPILQEETNLIAGSTVSLLLYYHVLVQLVMELPVVQFLPFLYHHSTDDYPIQLDESSAATERVFQQ
jgi:hypothetical protein